MATAKKSTGRAPAKKAAAAGKPDAIKLLTADHAEVKELFEQYRQLAEDGADAEEREALANRICDLLTVHTTIEEEILYPAAREAIDEQDLLDEAEVEHASAKDLIAQIQESDADEELYDAKVNVLGEYVNHHVQEEEKELLPKCKAAKMDLVALGEELALRKEELMGELDEGDDDAA